MKPKWPKGGKVFYNTVDEYFDGHVRRDPDGCWQWLGTRRKGYGEMRLSAHRWAYERWTGTIPKGLYLDHVCRNRGCVNPAHLEAVTQCENTRRASRKQTHCRRGHLLSGGNLWLVGKMKKRRCRTCSNRLWREWYARGGAGVSARRERRSARRA